MQAWRYKSLSSQISILVNGAVVPLTAPTSAKNHVWKSMEAWFDFDTYSKVLNRTIDKCTWEPIAIDCISQGNVALSLCFLIRQTTVDLRTCFLLWHKSAKCCVFPLFSHTKDARGLADLFSLKGINLFLNCFKRNKSAQVRVAFCLRGATKTADLLG